MTKRRDAAAATAETVRRIAGPDELVQAVPYLLGFHPSHSLVLVGLHDGLLVVTARFDLDRSGGVGGGAPPDLVGATIARMCDGGASEVIAAIYSDVGVGADAPAVVADVIAAAVDRLPCRLLDVLLVVGGRWWSLTCESPQCCPPTGREVPIVPSEFAAAATVDGVVPLADRTALEATLTPRPDRARLQSPLDAAVRAAAASARDRGTARRDRALTRAVFAAARASVAPRWSAPADDEACRFTVALGFLAVRDSVWLAVDQGRLDGRPLWRDLAHRVPAPFDAGPLFLYGWASWRAGDGALARMAAERALDSDGGYSAADLLLAALARGIDPRNFPRLRRSA